MLKYWRIFLGILSVVLGVMVVGMPLIMNGGVLAQDDGTPTVVLIPTEIPVILQADIDRTEIQVQDIRQLTATDVLNREIMSEDDLRHVASRRLADQYLPEEVQSDLLFYEAFGFIDGNANLFGIAENLVVNQTADFYDREQNVMYMVEGNGLDPFRSILYARHYALALQNQNFDTQRLIDDALEAQEYDRAMALLALFEGDAHLTTLLFAEELIEQNPTSASSLISQIIGSPNVGLNEEAAILSSELLFPSEAGLSFVQGLFEESNDWRLVNAAYQRLPLSTEQILHPTLYLLYEEPHDISLLALNDFWNEQFPNEEWNLVRDQALGEFYLREHLRLFFSNVIAGEIAAGWGGDRFLLYRNEADNEIVMVWKTSGDTPEDALQFDLQYGDFLGQWFGVPGEIVDDNQACWVAFGRNACKVTLENDEILIVFAPTIELVNAIVDFQLQAEVIRIFG